MRLLFTFFLTITIHCSSLFACTCYLTSFCEYLDEFEENEYALIFKGSYLQEDSLTYGMKAIQFNVEKIYSGSIITPSSPLYTGEFYENTDTTVWLLSGSDASCLRWLNQDEAIFAVKYYEGDLVGYVPTICENDYFPISTLNMVTGYIGDNNEEESMSLSEFEEVILSYCTSNSTENVSPIVIEPFIYPQPVTEEITIITDTDAGPWDIILLDVMGNELQYIQGTTLNTSELRNGVYFLIFTRGHLKFVKKFIKI